MGAVKELLIQEIDELSELTGYSFSFLMSSWFKCADCGNSFEEYQSIFLQKGAVRKSRSKKSNYNNCFTLGGKVESRGTILKMPRYIRYGVPYTLYGGKDGPLCGFYMLSYEQASHMINSYLHNWSPIDKDDSLRISLYLDNAMYGNLHIFVIDFDRFDTESDFFKRAKDLADKITRSQGGGYHMFYGINKEKAQPLFDSINLLASSKAKSYVCATGKETLDGTNKVDFFCDARQFIYEWEEWDNEKGLTDKTLPLYELIRDNFSLKRQRRNPPMEARPVLG